MFIWQSFLYLFKGAKLCFLSSPKCPKWPRVKREEFPCKQWYQNPSQYYYKLLAVKVVWVDALLAYLLKNSLLTPPRTKNISNPHF